MLKNFLENLLENPRLLYTIFIHWPYMSDVWHTLYNLPLLMSKEWLHSKVVCLVGVCFGMRAY